MVIDSRRSCSTRTAAIARISLDLVKELGEAEYFLLSFFFGPTQTTMISVVVKPSVAAAVSHTLSSSPFRFSFSHPLKELSRRTAAVAMAMPIFQADTAITSTAVKAQIHED